MITTTQAYKDAMAKQIRDPSFMRVSFGIFNVYAHENYNIEAVPKVTPFSSFENMLNLNYQSKLQYATFENKFWLLDGSKQIAPDDNVYLQKEGFVNKNINEQTIFTLSFDTPQDFIGLTFEFDLVNNYYPTTVNVNFFDYDDESNVTFYSNSSVNNSILRINETYTNVGRILINCKYPVITNTRIRITKLKFGLGYVYNNNDLTNCEMTQTVNPVSINLPTKSFSFSIHNYDKLYDIDNPDSPMNFLQENQDVIVDYGISTSYDSSTIEWIQFGKYKLSKWSSDSDGKEMTFTCTDSLATKNAIFHGGKFGTYNCYDLAMEVLTDMEYTNTQYYVHANIANVITTIPIPSCTQKEALQLIANASRSVILIDNEDKISLIPKSVIDSDVSKPIFTLLKNDSYENKKTENLPKLFQTEIYYNKIDKNETETDNVIGDYLFTISDENLLECYFTAPSCVTNCVLTKNGITISSGWTLINNTVNAYKAQISLTSDFLNNYSDDIINVRVYGNSCDVVESVYIKKEASYDGEIISVKNPIISIETDPIGLATHISDYAKQRTQYTVPYRGNPEVEMYDGTDLETSFYDALRLRVLENKMSFSGGLSGEIKVRGLI